MKPLILSSRLLTGVAVLAMGAFYRVITSIKLGAWEIRAGEGVVTDQLNLPARLPSTTPMLPQALGAQLHAHWLPQPRFQLLGPAVGPLVTGHYDYRDAYFPWRTR